MDSKTYIQNAIRTESIISSIEIDDPVQFHSVVESFIITSTLLDLYKKNIFYGKPIDKTKWDTLAQRLIDQSKNLTGGKYIHLTKPKTLTIDPRVFHAIVGIATESGELVEAMQPAWRGDAVPLDYVNLSEEVGDLNWYQAILIDATGADWDDIRDTNIAKLKNRYPDKFDSDLAINRNLESERAILEGADTSQNLIQYPDVEERN